MTATKHAVNYLQRVLRISQPEDPEVPILLLLQVEITCPACSDRPIPLQLAGHHLRALRQILDDVIAQHPDLCPEHELRRGVDTHVALTPRGGDPRNN